MTKAMSVVKLSMEVSRFILKFHEKMTAASALVLPHTDYGPEKTFNFNFQNICNFLVLSAFKSLSLLNAHLYPFISNLTLSTSQH